MQVMARYSYIWKGTILCIKISNVFFRSLLLFFDFTDKCEEIWMDSTRSKQLKLG